MAVSSPAAGLPQGVSESVSEELLQEGLLPRDLSPAYTDGLPQGVSESLPPPLLLGTLADRDEVSSSVRVSRAET